LIELRLQITHIAANLS